MKIILTGEVGNSGENVFIYKGIWRTVVENSEMNVVPNNNKGNHVSDWNNRQTNVMGKDKEVAFEGNTAVVL